MYAEYAPDRSLVISDHPYASVLPESAAARLYLKRQREPMKDAPNSFVVGAINACARPQVHAKYRQGQIAGRSVLASFS